MALVDEITLTIKAGDGGNGVEKWLHEKGKEFGGPAGGDGGRGGDVYVRAVRDIGILAKYRGNTDFYAEDGEDGKRHSMHGSDGEALYIELPIGAIVNNKETGERFELLKDGEEKKILSGGQGGYGNEHFKSSRNVRPTQTTKGKKGEFGKFYIELALIADAGFIGLPNAGKSSLLNALTRSRAKVGEYQFTTLDPNLGDLYGYILADIPGLIEGASEGKGLGHKFLKHITRTRILIHCVSFESADPLKEYNVIREELASYSEVLEKKEEIIILTKSDLVTKENGERVKHLFKKETGNTVHIVSILDDTSVKVLSDDLVRIFRSLKSPL